MSAMKMKEPDQFYPGDDVVVRRFAANLACVDTGCSGAKIDKGRAFVPSRSFSPSHGEVLGISRQLIT
jgi:hypothetical protein